MTRVARRHVFYLSGFDPRGARHYHQLYKTESALQQHVNGLDFNVSSRRKIDEFAHGWQVKADGVETQVEFLSWDDIIRRAWRPGMTGVLRDLGYFIRHYIATGLIWKFGRTSWHRLVAGFYPVVWVFLSFALAVALLARAEGFRSLILATALSFLLLKGAFMLGEKLAAFWLLRIYVFSTKWADGQIGGIDARLEAFSRRVLSALREGKPDEVMIVSHSVGTMLAVSVAAKVLRGMGQGQKLSFVTLGECIPLMSFQKNAAAYRGDLQEIARDKRLLWADYTAPADGACFPLLDPVAASGLEASQGAGPRLLSPRFFKLYSKRNYRRLRFNWYKMHFLYLMSTDHAGDYDYFAMTAGPQSLAARLAEV